MARETYLDDAMHCDRFVASQESLNREGNPGYTERPPFKEPLWFCKVVTKCPRLCFGLIFGVHTICAVLSLSLVLTGFDLFPVDFAGLPLHLVNEPWLARELAYGGRFEFAGRIPHEFPAHKDVPRSHLSKKSLVLLYNAAVEDGYDGNVFTKRHLQLMQHIEDSLVAVPGYKEDMCQFTVMNTCAPPISILRFFDGTYAMLNSVFYDPHFNNISSVLYTAYTSNETKGDILYALSKSYVMAPDRVSVSLTRSIIPFGGIQSNEVSAATRFIQEKFETLLDGYLDIEQLEFLYYSEDMMIEDAKKQGYEDMKLAIGSVLFIFCFILFHTRSLWVTSLGVFGVVCSFVEANLIYRYVLSFRYFGFFHVLAMFIILGIGADDVFIFWDSWRAGKLRRFPSMAHRLDEAFRRSCVSMLVTSLTTTLAFAASALSPLLATRSFGVFSAILVTIQYVSVVTFFPTVVIMYHLHFEKGCCCCGSCCPSASCLRRKHFVDGDGVGPRHDDGGAVAVISVLPHDQSEDLSDAGNESCMATFEPVTTAEAATPKVTTGASRVEAPNGNYNSDYSSGDPPISRSEDDRPKTTIWYMEISDYQTPADSAQALDANENCAASFFGVAEECAEDTTDTTGCPARNLASGNSEVTAQTERTGGAEGDVKKPGRMWLAVFFGDHYLRLVTHTVWRWVLIALFLGVAVFFLLSAVKITPDDQQVGLFKESHHYTRAFRFLSHGFVENSHDTTILLWMVWGLKPRDMSSCHFSDYKCIGRQVFDASFDPDTPAAQRSFVKLCDTMFNLTDQEVDDLRIRRDPKTGKIQVFCFARDMTNFLRRDPLFANKDVAMPWDAAKVEDAIQALQPFFNGSAIFNSSYPYFLDVPMNYWLWDAYRQRNTAELDVYNDLIAEEVTDFTTTVQPIPHLQTVKVGNRIKFIAVKVVTTMRYSTLSYYEHLPVLDRWERFMQQQLSTMPPEMQGGFQQTQAAWHWIQVQKSLVDNAVMGLALGASVSLPILILCTCNVINGLLASLTISCVTVCVIGVVPMSGWKLGVLVSLNMCLVVGLAVDYVVHLAEGYCMARARDRKGRLKSALESMGVSVFSGACTSLGASTFMLFAKIQFFYQFGIFMWSTIGFSLFFSMGLYVTIMGLLGPEDNTGDIRVPLRACLERLKRCQKLGVGISVNLSTSQSAQQLLVDFADVDDNA